MPWNFPIAITSWKIGPALATGNTIVVKPAELTPLSALRLAELALDAGIPEGVLQVVVGQGEVVGTRLVEHPDVAKVAFTGSTEVGRRSWRGAAGTLKRVTLELGGKSASVVFADADLELAAAAAPAAVFANAGQDCCARSRVLVERSVYDRFLELLVEAVGSLDGRRPRPTPPLKMGPLITEAHRVGGGRLPGSGNGRARGGPVVPAHAGSSARRARFLVPAHRGGPGRSGHWRLAREEIFGPVIAVIPFEDEADAVRMANDTPTGCPARSGPATGPVPCGWPAPSIGQPLRQLEQLGAGPDRFRRHEAIRHRPGARSRGAGLLHRGEDRFRLRRALS